MHGPLVILTRVCLEDFDIFKIWIEYYRRRYEDMRCCIFKRPGENLSPIIDCCDQNRLGYIVSECAVFDDESSLAALRLLSAGCEGRTGLLVDCDEFISDFDALDWVVANRPADSLLLPLVDRVSVDLFYDISGCRTCEDLCR